MKHKFLGKDVELKLLSMRQYDEVQYALLGDANITEGKAETNIKNFKKSQYLTIEYGTVDESITEDYILDNTTQKDQEEITNLYEAIVKFNG